MSKTNACRKWIVTINNPDEQGYTQSAVLEKLQSIKGDSVYYCFCDVIGGVDNAHHIHIFIYRENGIRFAVIDKLFYGVNFMQASGPAQNLREFVINHCINRSDIFVEYGICPVEERSSPVAVRHSRGRHGK